MSFFSLFESLSHLFRQNGSKENLTVKNVKDLPIERTDEKLSDHFSLFELTTTSNMLLQKTNRMLTEQQLKKLKVLAQHAECIRMICESSMYIHSGYRSESLNGAIVGSSSTSQHPKCEAIDFSIKGQSPEDSFTKLLTAAREGKFKFGQLILERAERSYGIASWVHCSVTGTLSIDKLGQVMKMSANEDGTPHYTLIERLKF